MLQRNRTGAVRDVEGVDAHGDTPHLAHLPVARIVRPSAAKERRAFATDAASVLPRYVVSRAGGWEGLERLDDHYVRPRDEVIARKLGDGPTEQRSAPESEHASTAL